MKFQHLLIGTGLGLAMMFFWALIGCSSEELQGFQDNQQLTDSTGQGFSVTTTLCRKVGRKSGRRIGVGQEFKMAKKSYVRALVDFKEVKTERPYVVHLAWIRPDGKEMYRKYAKVRLNETSTGDFQILTEWLKAEDLHYVKTDTLLSSEPAFTLKTKLNISEKKAREAGQYHFRVYLDRRLLLDEPFLVTGSPETVEQVNVQ